MIAVVHESMKGFKGHYCATIRVMGQDAVDPFEQVDLREKSMAERRRYEAERAMQRALVGAGQKGGQAGQAGPGRMFGSTPATGSSSLFGGGGFVGTQTGAARRQVLLFGRLAFTRVESNFGNCNKPILNCRMPLQQVGVRRKTKRNEP